MERTVLLHDLEELNDDLGGWADHNLALAGLLGVVDGIERIVEDGSLDHFGGRFSGREGVRREVSEGGCHVSGPCPSGARRVCFWEDHEKAFFSSSHPRQSGVVAGTAAIAFLVAPLQVRNTSIMSAYLAWNGELLIEAVGEEEEDVKFQKRSLSRNSLLARPDHVLAL